MTIRKIFCTVILLSSYCYLQAQEKLKIGDRLPDFTIDKILFDKASISTAEYKNKLLIIDFWATTCSGCVAALPKMEKLQNRYKEKIKILPVTYEPEVLVNDFWKKNKHTKNLTLPSVIEDATFRNYFPHEAIPHEVWVYNGKIIGITEAEYVDEYNIEQVLNGNIPDWPVKNDYYAFDATTKPLFPTDERQIDPNTKIEYAAISGYMDHEGASAAGVFGNGGIIRDSVKKTIRNFFINQAIFSSYHQQWGRVIKTFKLVKPGGINANEIIWDVKDPTKYMVNSIYTPHLQTGYRGDWMRNNSICFESVYTDKGQSDEEIAQSVIKDLDRLLGLHVRWEKRNEKVLVVVKTKNWKIPKTENNGVEVSDLDYFLNKQPGNPYVFNETGIKEKIRLKQKISSWTDIPAVRKALNEIGLDLIEQERMVDKFVFSEVDGGLLVNTQNENKDVQ